MSQLNDADSLVSDFEDLEYEAESPAEKTFFLPWHRPRKHYVREKQWCATTKLLLRDHPLEDGVLKYLGLPGDDLLDIRSFHSEICNEEEIKIKFLGFNTSARTGHDTSLNISLDEVVKLPFVDETSTVQAYDFASLSKSNSTAYNTAKSNGPYHIVNLDLCDGFGTHKPGLVDDNYYSAVHNLLAIQSKMQRPWVLFLTTRVDRSCINDEVLKKVVENYLESMNDCICFQSVSKELLNIDCENDLESEIKKPSGLLAIFLTGIMEWLISNSLEYKPQVKVSLLGALSYTVEETENSEDLVSLAIKFEPTYQAPQDPRGFVLTPHNNLDKCGLITRSLRKINDRKNVDNILNENSKIYDEMVDKTEELLESARYNIAEYRQWLRPT